jgi:hypothetical protein
MKIKTSRHLLIVSVALCFLYSCVNHDLSEDEAAVPFVVDCTGATEYSYSEDIVDIINANCAVSGCHDGSTTLPNWTNHETLADEGAEVQRRITLPLNHPEKMPRVGSITTEERQKLYCWIEQGALNN